MKPIVQGATLGLLALSATLSASANANCPSNLPDQFMQDCITVEGSGDSFPHPTYAYKKEYQAWVASQAAAVQEVQPASGGENNPSSSSNTSQ